MLQDNLQTSREVIKMCCTYGELMEDSLFIPHMLQSKETMWSLHLMIQIHLIIGFADQKIDTSLFQRFGWKGLIKNISAAVGKHFALTVL